MKTKQLELWKQIDLRFIVDGIILHLLEGRLGDTCDTHWVVPNTHHVASYLTETPRTVNIPVRAYEV